MTNHISFAEPNKRVRLGLRKLIRIKRGQDFIEALAWLSVVAVAAMFLIDGGVQNIKDAASLWSAISRLTALVATDLLLIHMLLIARVPWIDRLYGHDRATGAHKKLGKPILYLVVAHFIASIVNYALVAQTQIFDALVTLVSSTNDMLIATASLVLMIAVEVTSLNFARRALSYEAWYIVHLMSYLAVFLAIPHQFSTGSDIAGKPVQTYYWVTLYLFVALNIIGFRFLAPIFETLTFRFKVADVRRESHDSTSIYLTGRNFKNLGVKAGQFYIMRVLTAKEWWRAHPFSISAAPNGNFIRFTVGDRGDDTSLLQRIKAGTKVILEGPYGVFTEERRIRERVTLIAAGIGAPPIRALAESMAARPGDIDVIYRVREEADAPLVDELRLLCNKRGFKLTILEGSRGAANSWMPAEAENRPDQARLVEIAPFISESDVYICGPAAWTQAVVKTLKKVGTPENQIHAEEFAW
ncbi:MAG: ferric reductase-like transmembrane domain-containing protein [Micrococcales bacterium]